MKLVLAYFFITVTQMRAIHKVIDVWIQLVIICDACETNCLNFDKFLCIDIFSLFT